MSLVLEALRKQHADADPAAAVALNLSAEKRRQRPWMALAALALLLNAGVVTWALRDRLFGNPAPAQAVVEAREATEPTRPTGEPTEAAVSAAAAQVEVSPGPPAAAPGQGQAAASVPVAPSPALPDATQFPNQVLPPPADVAGPRVLERVTLDALPADARARFPGIVISTHVYAEDPDLRAIVVNGARLQEGDQVAGLSIREIGPDGVAVEFENYVVEVPIFTDW